MKQADSIRDYLKEIGQIPLLNHPQELGYGRQIQQMIELQTKKATLAETLGYEPSLEEWAAHTQLTPTELNRIVRCGNRAKDKMVQANLRLVVSIANKYKNRGLSFQDLIQEGSLGLIRAAEKFDPTKGFKFSTYATWWIRQAVTRAIADQGRTVRLPIHMAEKLNKILKTYKKLAQTLGRTPTTEEVATVLEITSEQLLSTLSYKRLPTSLDALIGKDEDTPLLALQKDYTYNPEHYVEQQELKDQIQGYLSLLNPQQRRVLTLRYGLDTGVPMTLEQIGHELNLTRERIRQIESQALAAIRRKAK